MSLGPWVIARFDGECDECGGMIFAFADRIRADGDGDWLCERCGDDDNTEDQ